MTRAESFLFAALLLVSGCSPVCVHYPEHKVQVSISDVPKDITNAFYKACPNVQIVSVSRLLGGKTGEEFIFWVFRFKQDGKLQGASIAKPTDAPFVYDVQD